MAKLHLSQFCLEDWETGWIPTNRDRPYGLPPQFPGARAGSVKLLALSLVQRPGVNGKCDCGRARAFFVTTIETAVGMVGEASRFEKFLMKVCRIVQDPLPCPVQHGLCRAVSGP